MIKKEIILTTKLGLHARPSSMLAKEAMNFKSKFMIEKDGFEVDGKSIINIMMLGAPYESKLSLTVDGEDEEEMMHAILDLFERKFDEE